MSSRKFTDDDYAVLSSNFDGKEISQRGMGIVAPKYLMTRRRAEQYDPKTQFLYNTEGTRNFLLKNFPNLKTDPHERQQARIWGAVIYMFFRQGWGDSRIEDEFGWNHGTVGSIVQQIRRKIKGLRRNGKAYSIRKRGRPRKLKWGEREGEKAA